MKRRESYKYLGVLESGRVLTIAIKTEIDNECIRRIKNLMKSMPNGPNPIKTVITWVLSLLRCK